MARFANYIGRGGRQDVYTVAIFRTCDTSADPNVFDTHRRRVAAARKVLARLNALAATIHRVIPS